MNRIEFFCLALLTLMSVSACVETPESGSINEITFLASDNPAIEVLKNGDVTVTFSEKGGIVMVPFTVSKSWSAETPSGSSWLSISPQGGEAGSVQLKVEARMNTVEVPRDASVMLRCGALRKSIHISQDACPPPSLDVSCRALTFENPAGKQSFTITSNTEWSVSSSETWCKVTPASGLGDDSVTVEVSVNTEKMDRSAVVTVQASQGITKTVEVVQKGLPKLEVFPACLSVFGDGGLKAISISSNTAWTAVSDQAWCTVSPEEGSGDADLKVRVSGNPDIGPRSATITITSVDKDLSQTISINQAGNEDASFNWDRTFYHRSLILKFTATWCGYCPMMDHSLDAAKEKYPDRFVSVNIHGNGSVLEFSQHHPLSDLFTVLGYPSSYMDFRREIANYPTVHYCSLTDEFLKEQKDHYPVVTATALESSVSGDRLDVNVTLFIKEKGDYKITVFLTESGIVEFQADHTDGDWNDYRHDDVVRMSLTDVLGDQFSVSSAHTRLSRSYSVSIPSGYDKDKLKLLVYVQRAFGSLPRLQDGSFGDFYVDNCVYAEVGRHLPPALVNEADGENENVIDGKPVNW